MTTAILDSIVQLPAPLRGGQFSAISETQSYQLPTADSFEQWLETDLGQEVHRRILNNLHSVWMELSASYFDNADDVQQKALIWLWQRWESDPGYISLAKDSTCLSHAAGCITKVAVMAARCKYAKRKREGREKQTDLFAEDGYQLIAAKTCDTAIRATDIHEHDRLGSGMDKRTDVRDAVDRVAQKMVTQHSIAQGNYRRVPIEHITRTIVEGIMHHYVDRYSQRGNFRQFCEARGVSKNQIARWRPQIFKYLREELAAYAPV